MSFFAPSNYSTRYQDEIVALTEWFKARLPPLGAIVLSQSEYSSGVDALKGAHRELRKEASRVWNEQRKYDLSYNQMCVAFFAAAHACGLLAVTA
jgi:hypothetical protein